MEGGEVADPAHSRRVGFQTHKPEEGFNYRLLVEVRLSSITVPIPAFNSMAHTWASDQAESREKVKGAGREKVDCAESAAASSPPNRGVRSWL